ncbi:MAG TPA: hypothetical protein ENJ82_05905 [Bacteroidetes bacterium]|nr:hypothetical protein [Bacteroidota bacterium]
MAARTSIFVLLIALLLGGSKLAAQSLHKLSDLPEAFQETPKIILKFDSKQSTISNRNARIFGLRVGMSFDNKAATGFGIHFLASEFTRNFIVPDGNGGLDSIPALLDFRYMSLWFEYMILSNKRWELSLPLAIGLGEARFRGFTESTNTPMLFAETSFEAQYKIVEWLALSAGIGYRLPITSTQKVGENFNSPIYRLGIRLFLGYFYRKVFP